MNVNLSRKTIVESALPQGMASDRVDRLFAMALQSHQMGRLDEAEKAYWLMLQDDPDNLAALSNLGMIAAPDKKAALLRKAIALRPDYFEAHANLADFLSAQGEDDEALTLFAKAVTLRPDWIEGFFSLGSIFLKRGQLVEAAKCFQRCVTLKADFVPAVFNLGCTFVLGGLALGSKNADKFALDCFRRTVELAPDFEAANFHLTRLLEDEGCFIEAKPYRDRVSRPRPFDVAPAPDHRRTVLILCTPSCANTPFRNLLSSQVNSLITWYIDYATDAQELELPAYDLAFYAVGNADKDRECIDRAISFASRCTKPLLNPPPTITRTRRDHMPELLAGLPDVVVAPILRLSQDELKADGVSARLEQAGISFPMIVRPFGHQGGVGALLVETAEALEAATFEDAEYYYFIQYQDYKSTDGYYRKYRSVFVDRKPYPYHLAISKDWLVHYFSADMLAEPWKLAEERVFLESSEAALGTRVANAVAAIGERMDMDYAGIDYTVLQDGRVFVFEANATMLVYPPSEPPYAHKVPYVQAILDGFEVMMERRIEDPRAPKPGLISPPRWPA